MVIQHFHIYQENTWLNCLCIGSIDLGNIFVSAFHTQFSAQKLWSWVLFFFLLFLQHQKNCVFPTGLWIPISQMELFSSDLCNRVWAECEYIHAHTKAYIDIHVHVRIGSRIQKWNRSGSLVTNDEFSNVCWGSEYSLIGSWMDMLHRLLATECSDGRCIFQNGGLNKVSIITVPKCNILNHLSK